MAEKWEINDSAREMTRKYNNAAQEMNQLARTALAINDTYITAVPSEFAIIVEELAEVTQDGA